jgi:hypothetical protein
MNGAWITVGNGFSEPVRRLKGRGRRDWAGGRPQRTNQSLYLQRRAMKNIGLKVRMTASFPSQHLLRCLKYNKMTWTVHIFMKLAFSEDRNVNEVLSGGWYQWEGEDTRKGCRVMNMSEMLCTHV